MLKIIAAGLVGILLLCGGCFDGDLAAVRQLSVQQLIQERGRPTFDIDASMLPAGWVLTRDEGGHETRIYLAPGHRVKIIIQPLD